MIRINLTQRSQRYKDHKEEGRGGFCPRTLRGLYDKITDKNPLFHLSVLLFLCVLCVRFLENNFGC